MPNKRKRQQKRKRAARPAPVPAEVVEGWSGTEPWPAKTEANAPSKGNIDIDLSIQHLPDVILIETFGSLTSTEQDDVKRVSGRWYTILSMPLFTKNIMCHAVPENQRCTYRSDMWNSCYRGHCTKERRTFRHRAHFSAPTALTFFPRPPKDFNIYQRMPCDIWLWMPRTLTKVTFSSVLVRFAQIAQLPKNVETVWLNNVQLVGITSMEEIDRGRQFYELRLPGGVDLRMYHSVSYELQIKRATLTGDLTTSLWDTVERVVAGETCPKLKEAYVQRIGYNMGLKVADPDEDWNSYVNLFVWHVIAGRDPKIQLPAQDQLDWHFPWVRLKPATLFELDTGLEHIVGMRRHQLDV